ncbi:HNH endonuclease [bacterium]|nr:HNH endonuclease [bacterium]
MFRFIDNFGRSSSWNKVRNDYIKNNPKCAACGKIKNLEVHHIIPYKIDKTKELDIDNLITLCRDHCHFVFGHFMDWKSYNPEVKEDASRYLAKIKQKSYLEEFQSQMSESAYDKNNFFYSLICYIDNIIKCWYNRS